MYKRLPSALHFCSLVIVPVLAVMFASPASAQVSSSPESRSESQSADSTVHVTIDKSRQTMTVALDGVTKYVWPVSTGKAGYSTPSGSYTATSMNEIWYSKEWDSAPMPHSVFFRKDGYAIHGSLEVRNLGRPASHGCVRISPENAATFFALVKKVGLKNTEVVLTGVTPGGEYKVARDPGARYGDDNNYYGQTQWGGGGYAQPQWGGGYYGRQNGNPYYTESQGYYRTDSQGYYRRPPREF